ncbi:prepilin-type N-terminal cleavage/methylation domain-containing protein [Ilumatobacter sp.]|uniref:prepilin-type N-terminal cleavage/methylation domain-containing protein n=1 Tax=Ilumatobacter sp. TaxID=1967498 RepID=UPI003AF778BF
MGDRSHPDDRGFTLIEAVIVVVLLGLVSLVIGFAITTVLRVTPTAESRVSTARSVQGLTVWFPADVASAVASGSNIITTPSGLTCVGSESTPGVNLIELQWTVSEPATATFVAAYRLEPGVGGDIVHRYECSSATGPFNDTTSQALTGPLASGTGTASATPSFDEVALQLQADDGTPIRIEATPRNPDASLPTTTLSPPLPPPTSPPICSVTFDSSSYGPVGRHTSGDPLLLNKLLFPETLTVSISGFTCGTITIEYNTGVEDKSQTVSWSGSSGLVIIPKGDITPATPQWTAANHTISVYNNCPAPCATPPLDTTILEVT